MRWQPALDDEIQERLVEASRLAALGRLLPSIVHQMSTPLSALALRVESIGREPPPEGPARDADCEKRRRHVKAMVEETQRCQDLLATVREFASADERGPTRFNLAALCRVAVLLLSHEAMRRQVSLLVEGDHVTSVSGRKLRLGQAVLALLTNALDASPRGGQVRIIAEAKDGEVTLVVEDQGPGVPASIQERLFQPFSSSQLPELGLGLGLAVCRVIAEGHRGSVGWEPRPGGGSRFILRIPQGQVHAAS